MADASDDPTIFTARSLPSDPRLWATLTNGYLGTRVFHGTLHVNGVYNGALGDTHRAVLPSPLGVQLEAPVGTGEQLTTTYALDTNTGSPCPPCPLLQVSWGGWTQSYPGLSQLRVPDSQEGGPEDALRTRQRAGVSHGPGWGPGHGGGTHSQCRGHSSVPVPPLAQAPSCSPWRAPASGPRSASTRTAGCRTCWPAA